jgi:hypothetical protein
VDSSHLQTGDGACNVRLYIHAQDVFAGWHLLGCEGGGLVVTQPVHCSLLSMRAQFWHVRAIGGARSQPQHVDKLACLQAVRELSPFRTQLLRSRGECRASLRCMLRANVALWTSSRLILILLTYAHAPATCQSAGQSTPGVWTSRTQTLSSTLKN